MGKDLRGQQRRMMTSRVKQDRVTTNCLGGRRVEFRERMCVESQQNTNMVNVQCPNVII